MASSLDDMEAYELLQIELDRSLKQFLLHRTSALNNEAQVQHFLNSWIEYICFVRHLWVWEEVVKEDTNEGFFNWYKEISGQPLPLEVIKSFQSFFKKA
jgi:hypothetical protein